MINIDLCPEEGRDKKVGVAIALAVLLAITVPTVMVMTMVGALVSDLLSAGHYIVGVMAGWLT